MAKPKVFSPYLSFLAPTYFFALHSPSSSLLFFSSHRERGVVINNKETTVGEVTGDGLVLSFSQSSVVENFYICLRSSEETPFDIPDFGFTNSDLESIWPLGLLIFFMSLRF